MNTTGCLQQSGSSLVLLLGFIAYLAPVVHGGRNSRCSLTTSAVPINDVVTDGDTRTMAFCRGIVQLNMCEGHCKSKEFPSATATNGFDRVSTK